MSKLIKKRTKSEYQNDIISLTGIDFEAIPKGELLIALNMCQNIAPIVTDRRISSLLSNDEIKKLIEQEMGMDDTTNLISPTKECKGEMTCDSFRKNYRKRRSGKLSCDFRISFSSFQSFVLTEPVTTPEKHDKLINSLKEHFPFTILSDNTIELMFLAMSRCTINSGLFLSKEGDISTRMYYIESGLFGSVLYDGKCYVTEYIKPGSCLGCDRLFFGNHSAKSIKCLNNGVVWILEAKHFHSACHWDYIEKDQFLYNAINKASGISGQSAYKLINSVQEITLGANRDVLDAAKETTFFIIFKGEVEVKYVDMRGNVYESTKKVGDAFGCDRLFTPRFCQLIYAVTSTPVKLFYLSQEVFERLLDTSDLYVKFDMDPKLDDLLFYSTL